MVSISILLEGLKWIFLRLTIIFEIEGISHDEVKSNFVKDTSKIKGMKINAYTIQQADSIRKILFAIIDNVRVILVKHEIRLDRMRNLKSIEEKKQHLVSAEVIDIWAPLAQRNIQRIRKKICMRWKLTSKRKSWNILLNVYPNILLSFHDIEIVFLYNLFLKKKFFRKFEWP